MWWEVLTAGLTTAEIGKLFRVMGRLALVTYIAYSLGFLSMLGFPGFLSAADGQAIARRVSKIEISLLERSLLNTATQICGATNKQYLTERFNELYKEYYDLTGTTWRVPACNDLR